MDEPEDQEDYEEGPVEGDSNIMATEFIDHSIMSFSVHERLSNQPYIWLTDFCRACIQRIYASHTATLLIRRWR
jgi:hypothetical protein